MSTITKTPTSDGGVSGTWSGSSPNRYTLVDDYPDSSADNTSESGGGVSYIDFGIASLGVPAGATAISVAVEYYDSCAAGGGGNRDIGSELVISATRYQATQHTSSTTATVRSDTWAVDPSTGLAWTVAGVNAIAGIGCNMANSARTGRLWSIQITATYTPAAGGGPANLKTVNGLAKASVKTKAGLAMASIKKWNGLA